MTEKAAKNKHRDWSQLVPEILHLIASSLSLDDYYRFQSVCTAWRHATLSRSAHRHPLPWLVYSMSLTSKTRGFYCLQNKRFYQIPLPKGRCAGTSHGWLIMSDNIYGSSLLNPFTGNKISLPNQSLNFPTSKKKVPYWINKAILSSEPTVTNIAAGRCVVAAIVWDDNDNHLAFCRPGDQSWTSYLVGDDFDLNIANITFSNGKLYAISRFLWLYVFDIVDKPISWRKLATHPLSSIKLEEQEYHNRFYLVESRGELLLIVRVMLKHLGTWRRCTQSFSVFKLDTRNDPKSWVRVEDIHGRILFVARGPPQLIELSDFHDLSGFESNCIYYIDDEHNSVDNPNLAIGVFWLDGWGQKHLFPKDGISCIQNRAPSCVFPSIWITPNPY
ncbi:hypothetical protein HS088_TW21G01282 [Tripterygium wilfordii]|uniref:DUF295 domain-containing protein n=1 Tax=Tripterygium wilfordii TaxID=458696 RepID=A0A7J7C4S8_TRIWF|nr:F-box protein At2g05970-like [Tripterygium wilfordii]KAF5729124.1 hypothetical protein HS088_TW21G01282 [Tripterygium wilfordii]